LTPGYGEAVRLDARINRELVTKLLDADRTAAQICKRAKISLRTLQAICKELHRRPRTGRRQVRSAPLADVVKVRRLVGAHGATKAAAMLGVSRQAVYQRLARAVRVPPLPVAPAP
jgi:hypothetical protein